MARQTSAILNTTALTTVPNTAEVASAAISPPGSLDQEAGTAVLIIATIDATTGANTTSVILRIRQGSGLTGTIIGTATLGILQTSTSQVALTLVGVDLSPVNLQYTATWQQGTGTATGQIQLASLAALQIAV